MSDEKVVEVPGRPYTIKHEDQKMGGKKRGAFNVDGTIDIHEYEDGPNGERIITGPAEN
jgi:hypothetical protein